MRIIIAIITTFLLLGWTHSFAEGDPAGCKWTVTEETDEYTKKRITKIILKSKDIEYPVPAKFKYLPFSCIFLITIKLENNFSFFKLFSYKLVRRICFRYHNDS